MDKQKRQDIILKICCIVTALVLWTYIRVSENPVVTSTIKYVPVQILNGDSLEERSLVIMPNQDYYINLSVKATATTLSDIDKNKDFKLEANLQGYALIPGENKIKVTIKEAPAGLSVVNADGLFMKIDVDNLVSKELPVEANILGKAKEGYYNEGNSLSPSKATISGPERYVNQVAKVIADIDISGADKDLSKSHKLKCVDDGNNEVSGVTINPEYAQVTSKINKRKDLTIVPITKGSLGASLLIESIEVSPKTIVVSGTQEEIDKYTTIETEPIDLSKITADTTIDVKLNTPDKLSIVQSDTVVAVKISIKKVVEKTIKVPLEYINLKEGHTLTKSINEVEVTIRGDSRAMEAFETSSYRATANLKDLNEGVYSLKVDLIGIPDNIEVKNITPSTVDVEIMLTKEENEANGN